MAATTDPAVRITAHTTRIRLGPNMSPSRPNIGVATAPVSRVAVTAHDASAGVVPSKSGSWGTSGTTSVCINDTATPAAARTAISRPPPFGGAGRSVICTDMTLPPSKIGVRAECGRIRLNGGSKPYAKIA